MNRRERLQAAIAGETVDRPPVALWRHWPGDDQRPDDLGRAVVEWQRRFDFDFVKVTPASSYCIYDWGARDVWLGGDEGTREYTNRVIQSPDDWTRLSVLDPQQGRLGETLEALRWIGQELAGEVPFVHTIFNPLAQAKNLVGGDELQVHLRRNPEAVRAGLEAITQTTIAQIEACKAIGIDGIFFAVQHATYDLLGEAEYETFGRPYDLRILAAASNLWLNIVHLHGRNVMFDLVVDYPVQIINWHDRETSPTLEEALARLPRAANSTGPTAVLGGLSRVEMMLRGAPAEIRAEAADAIHRTGGRRFILGTGCVTPITTPISNLYTARQAVEQR